jgi:hypothetical protein
MDIGYGIAEISHDGTAIITKHESLKGVVNEDTVRCQLLYELQGNIYLNSDVIADIKHIKVNQVEKNRVQVSNVAGFAPPSTTKLAVFYRGGFTFEYFVGATGLDIDHKIKILEAQLTRRLKRFNAQDKVYMEIQTYGKAQANATNQLASTTITRIYFQAEEKDDLRLAIKAIGDIGLQHFAGKHGSLHKGSYAPQPIVTYFPALIEQSIIQEKVHFVKTGHVFHAEGVSKTIDVIPRNLNESTTTNGVDISKFGPTTEAPLGRIAYTRSGDKGGNANVGIFVHSDERYDWLRSYMTTSVFSDLLGEEKKDYWVERVEFPEIKAIHFVVYGILGDGVSSTSRLDNFAKSFGEYVRQKWIPIPDKFLEYNTFAAHL